MAEVKQADREAGECEAGRIYLANSDVLCERDREIIETNLSQAFAAHREAAEKAEREACAKVAEKHLHLTFDGGYDMTGFKGENTRCRAIATAIRARGDGGAE